MPHRCPLCPRTRPQRSKTRARPAASAASAIPCSLRCRHASHCCRAGTRRDRRRAPGLARSTGADGDAGPAGELAERAEEPAGVRRGARRVGASVSAAHAARRHRSGASGAALHGTSVAAPSRPATGAARSGTPSSPTACARPQHALDPARRRDTSDTLERVERDHAPRLAVAQTEALQVESAVIHAGRRFRQATHRRSASSADSMGPRRRAAYVKHHGTLGAMPQRAGDGYQRRMARAGGVPAHAARALRRRRGRRRLAALERQTLRLQLRRRAASA